MFKIKLGENVYDRVTGFKGKVAGRAEYISGCRQYLVMPKCEKNKIQQSHWIDESRLMDGPIENQGGPQANTPPVR